MKDARHCLTTVKALGFRLPPEEYLLLVVSPVAPSLKPEQRDTVLPRVMVHCPMVRAQVNRAAGFVSRAVVADRCTEGDGRHIGNMSLQVLESAIDGIKLYGRREPYPDVTIQVGTMLMDSIQEEADGSKCRIGIVPWSSVATPMGWAESFGGRNTGKIQSALLSKGSIFLVANLHRGHNGRVLDQHPSKAGKAPVENEIADAVVLPILRSDRGESVGRVLGVGSNGLSYAHAESGSFSLSEGGGFTPIESEREDKRLHHSLLGLEGPGHGAEFGDKALRSPHSSCQSGA